MSILVKPGVEFAVIAPGGFLILDAIRFASRTMALDLTITSGTDGAHSGPNDPHHTGNAIDLRSRGIPSKVVPEVLDLIMAQLGWVHFFGFLESPGGLNEHFHFQTKRGTTFGVIDFLAFDPREQKKGTA